MRKDHERHGAVAIVGMGCRFPGRIASPQQFWGFLCNSGDAISEVPKDRWDVDALFSADPAAPGRTYARRGGFLTDIDQFDPEFFGISPREAAHIDPQQRLLLETAHEAIEDAGERWQDPTLRNTGVFVGVFIHDYQHMQFADRELLGAHTGTGSAMSIAANRISYVFDLHGPSIAVDTACSSSLVAVDLACKALLNRECDLALAGGVNVILKPEMTIAMSKATMLSRDGTCKSFDAKADGYVRGEGAATLVLRRLEDALAAGNRIYAVIRGSGVNSDGQTKGISVPNGAAQEALTRRVLRESEVPASTVDYVEAHGTGTPVGDPIEVAALGRVFSEGRGENARRVLLGSVKTNIGHLESASGVAGLMKAALALHHRQIPPNLHFTEPNPAIDFDGLRLQVVQQLQPWPQTDSPRRAAVNSFGFGGTNAHVILEESPASNERSGAVTSANDPLAGTFPRLVLPMGAADMGAVRALAQGYAETLSGAADVRDLLYTVSQRRSHGACRAAFSASNAERLREQLLEFAAGGSPADCSSGLRHESFAGQPVFVFSGMGPQWWAMARELLELEPVFRREVERCAIALRPLTDWSVLDQLLASETRSRIHETHVAQPAIFSVQVGLLALWRHWGVEPSAIVGHSVGEAAAMYAAGILSLEDAATVIYHRSRLQRGTAGSGSMLAARIDVKYALSLLRGREDRVAIGAINSATSLTLSGDQVVLEELRQTLEAEGKFARMLQVEVPYHSPKMGVIQRELLHSLREIAPAPAKVPYYSTIDGTASKSTIGDAEYWWRNVRQTVLFADAMDAAVSDGAVCFLELGPHPVLRDSIADALAKQGVTGTVVSSLRRGRSDFDSLALALSELHVAGATIAWDQVLGKGRLLQLPPYPWQRSRHWSESARAEQYRKGLSGALSLGTSAPRHPLLGGKLELPAPTWLQTLRVSEHSYLKDHCVQGTPVFPGTGYLEMALQTLADADPQQAASPMGDEYLELADVEIGRALYLADDEEVRLETSRDGQRWSIHGSAGNDSGWMRHASGRCRRESFLERPAPLDLSAVQARCPNSLPADYGYRLFRDVGLDYGPAFRAIQELWYGEHESLARLVRPAALGEASDGSASEFLFHPALLDACLHTLFGALNLNGEDADRRGNVFLPVSVRLLRLYAKPEGALFSHARLHTRAAQHFTADIRVYDESLRLIAEVLDLRCQALEHPSVVANKRQQEWLLEYSFQEAPSLAPGGSALSGHWLVLAPRADHPLVALLAQRGAECTIAIPGATFAQRDRVFSVPIGSSVDFGALLAQLPGGVSRLRGIVHAWCLASESAADPGARWREQELGAGTLMHLVQALALAEDAHGGAEPAAGGEPRALWVLTDQSQSVRSDDPVKLPHSTVWGLRRVIANEHPGLNSRIVDLDGEAESLTALADELAHASAEDELAFRRGSRFVHRLLRHVPRRPTVAAQAPVSAADRRMELCVHKAGDLKSMAWVPLPPLDLGANQIEIEVSASALNFKDVMKATGLFPARLLEENLWSHETLGMECSGRVVRVGSKVEHVRVGDDVLALSPRTFASHTVTHGALVVPNPGLTPTQAAGIPVAFLTASMGLEEMARLQPGERVLIHAASGGVGQAAIQIALEIGAEVYATAGSEAKRQLVRDLGVKHVFDSRSLRFAQEIREQTGGRGVDVVLNSLAGDAITQSLSILSDYGRFIEIGKMDLDKDFQLGLRPFTRCLSFHAIDLDRMLAQRVELCGRILRSIRDRIQSGTLRALPVSVYPAANAADAFYDMASAKHTGKLVVEITGSQVAVEASRQTTFRSDASYLITGGLGGFGLQLARWLAARGAGHLVLLGRRGMDTPGAAQAIASLQALGADVQVEACDVADADLVRQVLEKIPAARPLRGVFHAAAVLDDALLKNLDLARYHKTFGPKAAGAWHLHQQTLGYSLDHFMCFSSMASVLGNQGSANYCAANAFVDALAHHRRSRGLPALTVNWGVIADVGMAADEDFYRQNLERNGLSTIHSEHCLELLGLLLDTGRVQTTVCPIDLEVWLKFNPAGKDARLKELLSSARHKQEATRVQAAEEAALRARLDVLDEAGRNELAAEQVRNALAQVLRIPAAKLDSSRSLTALGADSLMAIELKNRLEGLGLAMSVTQLLNRQSVNTLSKALLQALGHGATAEDPVTKPVKQPESTWLVCRAPRRDAKIRLICFPYAGGGPSVYNGWPEAVPDWLEVLAVNLPGRGTRSDEPPLDSITQAAEAMLPELLPLLDRPFALFGHCMGAILMYEVAQRLEQVHGKIAAHIFASGCMAPHLYNSPIVHEQDDDAFLDVLRLISFSGTLALIEDPELRKTMFPLLRADFRAVVQYGESFRAVAPLRAPITGLAAENDLFAAPKAMHAWGRYTSRGYDLAQLPGDHYFVESDRPTVTKIVSALLEPSNEAALEPRALPALANVVWNKPNNDQLGRAPGAASLALIARRAPPRAALTRVLCFPPAGVSAAEFPLPGDTSDLRYEAVEWRGKGPLGSVRSVGEMVSIAHDAVQGRLDGSVVFYGHCLGAIVAYELSLRLEGEERSAPDHLIVAGVVGPHLYVAPDAHKLPTEKLLELLSVLKYPFAERLKRDPAFRQARLAMVRADLEAMSAYQYHPSEPLAAPITAVSMRHDLWSYPLRTESWRHHTKQRAEVVHWPGDHYYNMRHPEKIHELMRELTQSSVAAE